MDKEDINLKGNRETQKELEVEDAVGMMKIHCTPV